MQSRVPRTLYRQLLSWCRNYEHVPFDGIPPITLSPPQVNPRALHRLRGMRTFLDNNHIKDSTKLAKWRHPAHFPLYSSDVSVNDNMIVFPAVRNSSELRDVVRSVYWLNNGKTTSAIEEESSNNEREIAAEGEKLQISLAFEAIKSLNQLSNDLDIRRSRRQKSIEIRKQQREIADAPNVKYHVGQVVSHTKKGYRGVVVGWTVEDDKSTRLTSLTAKQYALQEQDDRKGCVDTDCKQSKIKYTILVDVNDATLQESSKVVSLESQEDLITVVEPCLQRIHNSVMYQYFINFDADHFTPNDVLHYIYPLDRFSEREGSHGNTTCEINPNAPHFEQSHASIVDGIAKINEDILAKFESSIGETNCNFLQSLLSDLSNQIKAENPSVYSSVLALYHFHVKVNSLLWSRKKHLQHKPNIKFSLGQVVRHKLYDYRGVVVAWNHKPHVDVTNWDGLQHVNDPQNHPFYHVIPDEDDCIRVFGGPRSFRYVCQENLELCKSTELSVDELNLKEWRWDMAKHAYVPSDEMRFLHGEDLESDETIERCLKDIRNTLSEYLLLVREDDSSKHGYFSMSDLFNVLQSADTLEHATAIQDMIKEIWKECSNKELRNSLDTGISYLVEGNNEKALAEFTKITQADSSYMEAWNKKATAHYMSGHMNESRSSAQMALELEPRNFQALAGIGLVEMDSSSLHRAVEAFKQCLNLHPWSMVSARLAVCLKKIQHQEK